MIVRISHASDVPLYMQIRDQLVEAIACGELVAGDGLPSVRRLASDLGINLHTVNKAYALLRDEGYLVMRGRSGAFVADVERAASRERREITELHLADDLRKLAFEYKARGGGEEAFVELAAEAARRAYGDPGVAGARRARARCATPCLAHRLKREGRDDHGCCFDYAGFGSCGAGERRVDGGDALPHA